jgi:hypothetical protein
MKLDINPSTPTGARWASVVGTARARDAKPPRKKRFTGPTAESKAWEREQAAKGGWFIKMAVPNWMNHKTVTREQAASQRDAQRKQKERVALEMAAWRPKLPPPLLVTLTRYGPKTLDAHDNLRASMKYVVDEIARYFGIDDGDTANIRFEYAQEPARWCGVRIEVASAPMTVPEARAVLAVAGGGR